jgi:16S rRNA (adenine1518-N6/adenine1519-N6)-dimethyltransferase
MPTRGKRRALGQHFLRDASVAQLLVERVVAEARASGCRSLLEIGPGKGALTDLLLARLPSERLVLVERDPALGLHWAGLCPRESRLKVEIGDFLELPPERWDSEAPVGVVSNLPYSASKAILLRLSERGESIPFMVLMFQAEVAQRLRAEPSSKARGSLSVWIQNQWEVTRLCSVPPGAFAPPPEVASEVLVLRRLAEPRVPAMRGRERAWEELLQAAFAHRRKMLRSGLRACEPFRNALEASEVDGRKRAENLSWDEWNRILASLQ